MTNEEKIDELREIILDDSGDGVDDIKLDVRVKDIINRLNLLDWFLKNIYVASGMMEMKKCAPHNVPNPFRATYCNGIKIVDNEFDKYCNLAREYKREMREEANKK